MPSRNPLSIGRRVTVTVAVVFVIVGGLLAASGSQVAEVPPAVPGTAEGAPTLRYIRSLPDAGDAPLIRPVGLAVGDGRLYVSDSGDAVVRMFSTAGFDLGEVGREVLEVPAYITSDDATGTVFVVDRGLRTVLRFSEDGEPLGELLPSTIATGAWEPLGIAADGEGVIAATDSSGRHRMIVMDRDGTVEFSLGSAEASGTPGRVGVALDYANSVAFSEDEMWVSDSNNRRVLVFERDGSFKRFIRLDGIARGLAFVEGEEDQDVYVAVVDALGSTIILLDSQGAEITRYGGPGTTAGLLAYPNDVAYDPESSQLYVADTGNARVQVWEVMWTEAQTSPVGALERAGLSPMRLAGIALAAVGVLLAAAALWPRRR